MQGIHALLVKRHRLTEGTARLLRAPDGDRYASVLFSDAFDGDGPASQLPADSRLSAAVTASDIFVKGWAEPPRQQLSFTSLDIMLHFPKGSPIRSTDGFLLQPDS